MNVNGIKNITFKLPSTIGEIPRLGNELEKAKSLLQGYQANGKMTADTFVQKGNIEKEIKFIEALMAKFPNLK